MLYINRVARENRLIYDKHGFLALFIVLPLAAGLPLGVHATTPSLKKPPMITHSLFIQHRQGLIYARVRNTSLDGVCRDLTQKTGVRCVLNSDAARLPVSATTTGLPLREAIKKLLAGFSYAIYPADASGKLILKVLANPKDTDLKTPAIAPPMGCPAPFPPAPSVAMQQYAPQDQPLEMPIDPELQSDSEWDAQAPDIAHQESLL